MNKYSLFLMILALLFSSPWQENTAAAITPNIVISNSALIAATAGYEAAPPDSSVAEKGDNKVQQIKHLFSWTVILLTLLIIIITYFLVRALISVIDNLAEAASKHRLTIKRLVPIVRILLWSLAIYVIIAGVINPPFNTVLAVAASIGIAVGLASQDILKNIFGGFMIILDKPFQVGDKIAVDEYYGEVLQIGLRSTRLATPDDSIVSVPNGDAISKAVSNANSGNLYCQVVAEIYLPARTDIARAKEIAYKAAISSRYVYLKKPVAVIAKNEVYKENFVVKLRVKAYVLDIRFEFPFQSDMTEQILAECNKEGLMDSRRSKSRSKAS